MNTTIMTEAITKPIRTARKSRRFAASLMRYITTTLTSMSATLIAPGTTLDGSVRSGGHASKFLAR